MARVRWRRSTPVDVAGSSLRPARCVASYRCGLRDAVPLAAACSAVLMAVSRVDGAGTSSFSGDGSVPALAREALEGLTARRRRAVDADPDGERAESASEWTWTRFASPDSSAGLRSRERPSESSRDLSPAAAQGSPAEIAARSRASDHLLERNRSQQTPSSSCPAGEFVDVGVARLFIGPSGVDELSTNRPTTSPISAARGSSSNGAAPSRNVSALLVANTRSLAWRATSPAYLCSPCVSSPSGRSCWGVGVRSGAHAYLGPRLGLATEVGDMMVMGFPLGGGCGAAARSLEAVHADVAAAGRRELVAVHRLTWGVARTSKLMRARVPGRRVP